MKNEIKLFYAKTIRNFGDILNEDIFPIIGSKKVSFTGIRDCDYVAIGSLLDNFFIPRRRIIKAIAYRLRSPVVVWGSGFISPEKEDRILLRKLDVRAVRGYITLERLQDNKYVNCKDDVAIGDPGILISKLFKRETKKKYRLGIVPHYVDKRNLLLKNIKVKESVIIDIQSGTEEFINKLVECETIVSSSLHGLISADSYLIPNMRIVLGDDIIGGDYKYNDYYSGFGIKAHNLINLNNSIITDDIVDEIIYKYGIRKEQISRMQEDLINAFPKEINEPILS